MSINTCESPNGVLKRLIWARLWEKGMKVKVENFLSLIVNRRDKSNVVIVPIISIIAGSGINVVVENLTDQLKRMLARTPRGN